MSAHKTVAVRKLRMGMVGGGRGSFIGAVHRAAALMDGQIELVCGAFSANAEKALESGLDLGIASERNYINYAEMFARESALAVEQRMDFVAIVTPNNMHVPIATAALQAGFHVFCEKPVAMQLAQARELQRCVQSTNRSLAVAHVYTGYPMVKEARALIAAGKLGKIRKVIVEYVQGWLAEDLHGNKQADWRNDPTQAGEMGCIGDIGTHAANLVEYVTGLRIEALSADLSTFVAGRALDDDATALMKLSDGAKGVLHVSQVAAGEENNLNLRVYGELGGLEWRQQEPNSLQLKWLHEPLQILRAGGRASAINNYTRLPSGHPEGFIEALANLYRAFGNAIRACSHGQALSESEADFPGVEAGIRSMLFVQGMVASAASNDKWYVLA